MINFVEIGSSSPDNSSNYNTVFYNNPYVYAAGWETDIAIFDRDSADLILRDSTFPCHDNTVWTNNYIAQGVGSAFRLCHFDGSSITEDWEYDVSGRSRGITLNGSYVVIWEPGDGLTVYNYAGTIVSTLASNIKAQWIGTASNGTTIFAVGDISNVGAYISAYTINSSGTLTHKSTYTINSTTDWYISGVGYPNIGYPGYLYSGTGEILLAVSSSKLFRLSYNGTSITKTGEIDTTKSYYAFNSQYGNYYFAKSTDSGSSPYSTLVLRKSDLSLVAEYSTTYDTGLAVRHDNNTMFRSKPESGVSVWTIYLYKIFISMDETFSAQWL